MSKKKNNNQATESQVVKEKNEVVDTEVVEAPAQDTTEVPADDGVAVTTDAPVDDQPATEAPADEVKDDQPADDVPADDGAPTDTPVDTPAPDAPADKPADEAKDEKPADKVPTAPTAPTAPAKEEKEEKDDTAKQNNVDSTLMNRELMTSYKVRFAFSQSSKKYAAARTMTLYNMIDLFMTNRQGFVGCVEQKDFDHIKDYLLHNPVIYKYQEFKLDGRKQFIERLGTNTDYVIAHLK